MRAAESNNSNFCIAHLFNDRSRHTRSRVLELSSQPRHIVLVVFGPLAVVPLRVVPTPAGEISCSRMLSARQRSVADPVALNVLIAAETAKPVEIFLGQNLATL